MKPFRYVQTILITLIYLILSFSSSAITEKDLEGYKVKFDYEKYPQEREIALKFFQKKYYNNQIFSHIEAKDIGIDLFDINDNGYNEILAYVNYGDRCPTAGCPFIFLRLMSSSSAAKSYEEIKWFTKVGASLSIYNDDAPKILKSKTLGYHNIFFGEGIKSGTIWKWNGEYYDIGEVLENKKNKNKQ